MMTFHCNHCEIDSIYLHCIELEFASRNKSHSHSRVFFAVKILDLWPYFAI